MFNSVNWVVLPMAQPSQVEGRVRAMLATGRDRAVFPRRARIVATLVMVGLTALLATLRPVAHAQGTRVVPAAGPQDRQPIVVVDAGHGGRDTGALAADGTCEGDLNLAIAGKLRDTLALHGATVAMTRTANVFASSAERSAFGNRQQAQLLVSVHCGGRMMPTLHEGAVVYYHGRDAAGRRFASDVLAGLSRMGGLGPYRVQSDTARFPTGFYVLRVSRVPAVLVECGSMSNVRDVAGLRDARTQQRIAEGIADGVRKFLSDNPSPAHAGEPPKSLSVPVQQTSRPLTKTTPAQAVARLKRIYGFVQVYRRTHGNAYPATSSSPDDLMGDMAAHPQNYGLADRSADDGRQATDFFTLTDPHYAGPPNLIRIYMHGKRPDGTRVGAAKRAGTRDVVANTDLFVENRKFPGGWRTVGDYLVLWDDGQVTRVPASKMLSVPLYDPIGGLLPGGVAPPGTRQMAFPGQAGLPIKAVRKL